MRSDIVPGGIFPDYELPDHTSKLRKLSELQGDDPLILKTTPLPAEEPPA
jgi:peroxiredoxin